MLQRLLALFRSAPVAAPPPPFPPSWPTHATMLAWMTAWVAYYQARGFAAALLVNPYAADYLYLRAYAGRIGDTTNSLDSAWAALRAAHPALWSDAAADQRTMSVPTIRSRVGPATDFAVLIDSDVFG